MAHETHTRRKRLPWPVILAAGLSIHPDLYDISTPTERTLGDQGLRSFDDTALATF